MVTMMVMTNRGMAVFRDEKNLKTFFAAVVNWRLMTFSLSIVVPGCFFFIYPWLVSLQVCHDVH